MRVKSQSLKFISGLVSGAGVGSGPNWSARRTALGNYTIEFPPGFRFVGASVQPYAFVTAQVNASAPPDDHSFVLVTSTPNTGATADGGFYFLAWGN